MTRRILIIAGEASGDLHGAYLARAIRVLAPTVRLVGLGGEAMRAAGVEIRLDSRDVGVVGISELFSRLPLIWKAYHAATCMLRETPAPDLIVLIDCPGFNLRLAAVAKRLGVPVVYYIAPQVWAWRPQRLMTIRRVVDRLLVVLPFEEAFFRAAGVSCEFVGHPLLDEMGAPDAPEVARRRFGLVSHRPVISLLPGSRPQEVARHLPLMLAAATIMSRELTGLYALVALAPTISRDAVKLMVDRLNPTGVEVRIVAEDTGSCLAASDLALVASGTATLQAALSATPMVVIYRLSSFTYAIARWLVRVPHISLVNLIAAGGPTPGETPPASDPGRGIVPELIQDEATPQAIAVEALRCLRDSTARASIAGGLQEVRRRVGAPGASARAAQAILAMLSNGAGGTVR